MQVGTSYNYSRNFDPDVICYPELPAIGFRDQQMSGSEQQIAGTREILERALGNLMWSQPQLAADGYVGPPQAFLSQSVQSLLAEIEGRNRGWLADPQESITDALLTRSRIGQRLDNLAFGPTQPIRPEFMVENGGNLRRNPYTLEYSI